VFDAGQVQGLVDEGTGRGPLALWLAAGSVPAGILGAMAVDLIGASYGATLDGVLYRAIGQGANLEVDVFSLPIPRDAFLLLCSDGLWGVVPDQEIRRIVTTSENPQAACERLIDSANAAGGPDNISAVLISSSSARARSGFALPAPIAAE